MIYDTNVCNLSKYGASKGLQSADRTTMPPSECPTKLQYIVNIHGVRLRLPTLFYLLVRGTNLNNLQFLLRHYFPFLVCLLAYFVQYRNKSKIPFLENLVRFGCGKASCPNCIASKRKRNSGKGGIWIACQSVDHYVQMRSLETFVFIYRYV